MADLWYVCCCCSLLEVKFHSFLFQKTFVIFGIVRVCVFNGYSVLHLNTHLWSEVMLAALSVVLESPTNRCVKFVN